MKDLKSTVFKTFVSILQKKRKSSMLLEDLYKALPDYDREDILKAVNELDNDSKVFVEKDSIHQL
jgi:uncharacterized FAD-dependent dehydrogenase